MLGNEKCRKQHVRSNYRLEIGIAFPHFVVGGKRTGIITRGHTPSYIQGFRVDSVCGENILCTHYVLHAAH